MVKEQPKYQRLKDLEALVEELMKDQPEDKVIKGYMKKTGIPYKRDPIENINSVLQALHFQEDRRIIEEG